MCVCVCFTQVQLIYNVLIPCGFLSCWAAVSGVAQSRTRLKRLSSSSSSSSISHSPSPHLMVPSATTNLLFVAMLCCAVLCCSVVSDSVISWTVVCQAPLSMEFSRQEYWSGMPFPTPGDLPDSGMEPVSLMCPALAGRFFTSSVTCEVRERPSFILLHVDKQLSQNHF